VWLAVWAGLDGSGQPVGRSVTKKSWSMGRLRERRTREGDGGRFRSCEEQREQLRGRICGRGS
ncbi:hypothetical protein H0E87_018182, partial [Populus deltoides]